MDGARNQPRAVQGRQPERQAGRAVQGIHPSSAGYARSLIAGRASSPYLLSGILRCETCGRAMSASEAMSGKYTYYVCQSLMKRGSGTCKTPQA